MDKALIFLGIIALLLIGLVTIIDLTNQSCKTLPIYGATQEAVVCKDFVEEK